MLIIFSRHAIIKLGQRKINKQFVFETVKNPELIRPSYNYREELYKKFNKNYMKVVIKKEEERSRKSMKTNKGFTSVSLTLFIIGLLVVGGVVYYASKKSNNISISEQDKKPDGTSPSVRILYPNGGEVLQIGQTYNIRLETKNAPENSQIQLTFSSPSQRGGKEYILITNLDPNQPNYPWQVYEQNCVLDLCGYKLNPYKDYKIHATLLTIDPKRKSYGDIWSEDDSDGFFSLIVPDIQDGLYSCLPEEYVKDISSLNSPINPGEEPILTVEMKLKRLGAKCNDKNQLVDKNEIPILFHHYYCHGYRDDEGDAKNEAEYSKKKQTGAIVIEIKCDSRIP